MEAGRVKVQVGVGVLIHRDGKILLGKRKGSHGADSWAPPGGHLDFGETVEECARREALEETGLTLGAIRRAPYTEDRFSEEGKHYITLFVVAEWKGGEPELREPTKCAGWEWFRWDGFPTPLFLPLRTLRDQGFLPG